MAETIYINKKSKQKELERVKAEINKAIIETTKSLTKDINTLNDEYSNMLSAFELFVQQTNDAIASMEAEIEELKKEEYSKEYLTFEALEPTDITLLYKSSQNKSIEYSFDKSTWTTFTPASGAETIASLNAGGKMYVRGAWIDNDNRQSFGSTGRYKVSGNIMSLFYGDNFVDKTAFEAGRVPCHGVFYNSTLLTDASNLVLPATTLADYCYISMFQGCTSLTTPPELPATTLAQSCYNGMFYGCTSLTTAPVLPATTLAPRCYYQMFYECTSLTTPPELPATTLTDYCYAYMFYKCTGLTIAPDLLATILTQSCYQSMFHGCSNLSSIKCLATDISAYLCTDSWVNGVAATGTFTKDATMTRWTTGVNGIPSGWTVEDAA